MTAASDGKLLCKLIQVCQQTEPFGSAGSWAGVYGGSGCIVLLARKSLGDSLAAATSLVVILAAFEGCL